MNSLDRVSENRNVRKRKYIWFAGEVFRDRKPLRLFVSPVWYVRGARSDCRISWRKLAEKGRGLFFSRQATVELSKED